MREDRPETVATVDRIHSSASLHSPVWPLMPETMHGSEFPGRDRGLKRVNRCAYWATWDSMEEPFCGLCQSLMMAGDVNVCGLRYNPANFRKGS